MSERNGLAYFTTAVQSVDGVQVDFGRQTHRLAVKMRHKRTSADKMSVRHFKDIELRDGIFPSTSYMDEE